ncbi:hypothetical protein [Nodosilinea sp. E11]|uniref:hypothetical protein n=1 Tax=Nodosilinea sp. E11 TaxID=3037479 RepID=UPI00293518BD|nr:hypothetical protein [Nodosilinea sp. E11]WOD39945.1 hypothetical protein RRF56_03975 [Nodosilinea sp. E11]
MTFEQQSTAIPAGIASRIARYTPGTLGNAGRPLSIAITPGTLGNAGRPLSIAVTPPGLGQLPGAERQQMANYCAAAQGGIMGYKAAGLDKTRIAVLGQAIAVLSTLQTDNPLSIDRLISFTAEQDPLLVNAIGVLDPKHYKKLAEDLQTPSLMARHLFNLSANNCPPSSCWPRLTPKKLSYR